MVLQSKTSSLFFRAFVRNVILARMNQLNLKRPLMKSQRPIQMMPPQKAAAPALAKEAQKPLANFAPQMPPQKPTLPNTKLSPGTINWDRLKQMMADPSVQGLECQGPEKPLMLRKFGALQSSNMILSKEDIADVLKEISERTRIPLITGLFRVKLENYLITAVTSEFVGTTFIIIKQMPPAMQMRYGAYSPRAAPPSPRF